MSVTCFTEEATGAQRGGGTCPKSHSTRVSALQDLDEGPFISPSHTQAPPHLPELVLSHTVDVQRLLTLRQEANLHLPPRLALASLLLCLNIGKKGTS